MPRQRFNTPMPAGVVLGAVSSQPRVASLVGVLVVDDDTRIRLMLGSGLKRHGFQVWLAANGNDALDLYRSHRNAIDIVLLDVQMPGLDGPETLDALHAMDPELPACFMSGKSDGYSEDDLRQHGATYLFHKPFRLADIADALRRLSENALVELLPSSRV